MEGDTLYCQPKTGNMNLPLCFGWHYHITGWQYMLSPIVCCDIYLILLCQAYTHKYRKIYTTNINSSIQKTLNLIHTIIFLELVEEIKSCIFRCTRVTLYLQWTGQIVRWCIIVKSHEECQFVTVLETVMFKSYQALKK